jgi:SAM-dependent methyltransferase
VTTPRSIERHGCPVCSGPGRPWRLALEDRLFDAPGRWTLHRCTDAACGACWLDPAPDPRDLHLAYARYYTHAPDDRTQQRWWRAADLGYRAHREFGEPALPDASLLMRLRSHLPHRAELARFSRMYLTRAAGQRLLDVGCGAGNQMLMLRDLGWEVAGLDVDPQAVAAARARGLDAQVGDLLSPPEMQRFDAITMVHVIEHLVDPRRHLQAAHEALGRGGRLVIITPNVDSLGAHLFGSNWRGLEPPRHLQLFSLPALTRLLRDCGFRVELARSSARSSAALLRASRSLRAIAAGQRAPDPKNPCPGLADHLLELTEHAAISIGMPLGEELVVVAHVNTAGA